MANSDPRYERIDKLWYEMGAHMRPLDAAEAALIVKAVCNKFGLKSLGGPSMRRKFVTRKVRRVWLDKSAGTSIHRGWPRLAHDLSHMINRARHPSFPPHDNTQAILEYEISLFVVEWIKSENVTQIT